MDGVAAARLGGVAAEYEPTGVGRGGLSGRRGVHIRPDYFVADVAICAVDIAVSGGCGRAVEARVGFAGGGDGNLDMENGACRRVNHDDDITRSDVAKVGDTVCGIAITSE